MRKMIIVLLTMMIFGGCATTKINVYWWKEGGTEEQRRIDVDECTNYKGESHAISNARVLYGSPLILVPFVGGTLNIQRHQRQAAQPDKGFDNCMREKGYVLKESDK